MRRGQNVFHAIISLTTWASHFIVSRPANHEKQKIIAICQLFWPGNRARMEKIGLNNMSNYPKKMKITSVKLPPSYNLYVLVRTDHPNFILQQMEAVFPAFVKGIIALEDKQPIEDMSKFACYNHYSCGKRCKNGACLFLLTTIIENWLVKETKFEQFVARLRLVDHFLIDQYEKKSAKDSGKIGERKAKKSGTVKKKKAKKNR